MMQNKIYWLTGGSGSGKSIASDVMRCLGIYVIDADEIAHGVLKKGKGAYIEVLNEFGDSFLGEDGEIKRRELGKIVFSDEKKLEILNSITHKHIKEEIIKGLKKDGVTVIDAPLPHYDFLKPHHILYITAPKKIRIERIMLRDKISEDDAVLRLERQQHIERYINDADTIIENDGDIENFKTKIKNWCEYEKII